VWKRALLYIYVFNSFPLFWYMMGVEEDKYTVKPSSTPIIYQKRGKELKT
jgi:hypothetical protein